MARSKNKLKHGNHDIASTHDLKLLHDDPTDAENSILVPENDQVSKPSTSSSHCKQDLLVAQASVPAHEHSRKRKRQTGDPLLPAKRNPLSNNAMNQITAVRDLGAVWRQRSCNRCQTPLLAGFNLQSVVDSPCFSQKSAKKPVDPTVLCSIECPTCLIVACFACGKVLKDTKNKSRRVSVSRGPLPVCGCEESRLAASGILLSLLDVEEAFDANEISDEQPVARVHNTRSRTKVMSKNKSPETDHESPFENSSWYPKNWAAPPLPAKVAASFGISPTTSLQTGPSHHHPHHHTQSSSVVSDQSLEQHTVKSIEQIKKKFAESHMAFSETVKGFSVNASKFGELPDPLKKSLTDMDDLCKKVSDSDPDAFLTKFGKEHLKVLSMLEDSHSPFVATALEGSKAANRRPANTPRSKGIGYGNETYGPPTNWDSFDESDIESPPHLSKAPPKLLPGYLPAEGLHSLEFDKHHGQPLLSKRKSARQLQERQRAEAALRKQREITVRLLYGLLPKQEDEHDESSALDWDPPEVLAHMIRESQFRTITADALSDDILDADSDRNGIRVAVLGCVECWSHCQLLRRLITEDREPRNLRLFETLFEADPKGVSYTTGNAQTPLLSIIISLVPSCETTLRAAETHSSAYKKSKQHLDFCNQVVSISDSLKDVDPIAEPDVMSSNPWTQLCGESRVTFVEDEEILKGHNFEEDATKLKTSGGPRLKRIFEDIAILKTSLPEGVFVKLAFSRPDLMKFIIVGPDQTPYTGGLFEFHLFCPAKYPREPPKIWFPSASLNSLRLNPNLHAYGMVCLSLINTWSGMGNEMWQPGKSTILQVLVSMQSMIFCAEPFYNEPGFGSREDKVSSDKYSQAVQALTIRLGMLHWLQKDTWKQSLWKDFLKAYFQSNADLLIATAREWGSSNSHVTNYQGFREPMQTVGFHHHHHSFPSDLDSDPSPELLEFQERQKSKKQPPGQNLVQELEKAAADFKIAVEAELTDTAPV